MKNSNTQKPFKVFIVDDEETTVEVLSKFYTNAGYEVSRFASPLKALEALGSADEASGQSICDLIVSDLRMPEMDGLELIDRVKSLRIAPPVILLTGDATTEMAVEGLARGAFDYINKPIDFNEIAVLSDRAIKQHRLEEDYRSLKKELSKDWRLEDIVGKSPQIQNLFTFIRKVAQASCNVLITGESGTGKEMVARAIHALGPRAKNPFVAINCAAIPEALLESELFGHTKGSFTGATERRRGLFEDANEGTVFLDEIGDMPLPLQSKLLRFLQEKTVKSIGENTYRSIDVRVMAATHQNLEKSIRDGKFREDLYYRLCVAPVVIPPLRQRREDIILLAEHFLAKFARKSNLKVTGFTKTALAKLVRLPWPGNVRELENIIERAVIFSDGTFIDEKDIQAGEPLREEGQPTATLFSKLMSLETLEREYIEYVLSQTGNKREKAAEILGVDRKTLYRKQRAYVESSASMPASTAAN